MTSERKKGIAFFSGKKNQINIDRAICTAELSWRKSLGELVIFGQVSGELLYKYVCANNLSECTVLLVDSVTLCTCLIKWCIRRVEREINRNEMKRRRISLLKANYCQQLLQ